MKQPIQYNLHSKHRKNHRISYLCVALFLLISTQTMANINFAYSTYCLSEQNKQCLISQEVLQAKTDIKLGISEQAKFDEPYLTLLNRYYLLAKQNNLPEIIKLYSSQDGSRELVREAVRQTPTRYARFYKVGDIQVNQILKMGSYYALLVSWFDKQGKRLANWFEFIHCDKQHCAMSERLAKKTKQTAFYALFGGKHAFTGEFVSQADVDTISISQPKQSPSSVRLKLGIQTYANLSKEQLKAFDPALNVINTAVSNYAQAIAEAGTDMAMLQQISQGLFQPYWEDFNHQEMFFYPNKQNAKRPFAGMDYRVFASKIGRLKSATPAAILRANEVDFIFLWVAQDEQKEDARLLPFAISKQGKIVNWSGLKNQDATIFQFITHPFVYTALVQQLRNKQANLTDMLAKDKATYQVDFKKFTKKTQVDTQEDTTADGTYLWPWALLLLLLVAGIAWLIRTKNNRK